MKAFVAIATAVGVCAFMAGAQEKDFFGLPVTPKPATPKPGSKGSTPATPAPAARPGPMTPEEEIAAAVQRFKEATEKQDALEAKLAAPALAAYIKELEKLRDAALARGQTDAAREMDAAAKAAQAGEPGPSGKLAAPALLQAQANYERARETARHPYAGVRARMNSDYDRTIADLTQKFVRAGNLEAAQKARNARRVVLTVDSLVDGASTLCVRKDGLYWMTGGVAKPDPTFVDGKKWKVRWGKPDQPRAPDKSDIRPLSLPTLDLKVELVSVTERQGEKGIDERASIDIRPKQNELQVVIPDPESGGRWYKLIFREKEG